MELLKGMIVRQEQLITREKELNKEIEHLTFQLLEAIDFEEDYEWIRIAANRLKQETMNLHNNRQYLQEIETELEKIGNFIENSFRNLDSSSKEVIEKDILGKK